MFRATNTSTRTDTGRQRRENEDNLFVREPVFVVADGMGGAQAGEVASQIAVEQFQRGLPEAGSPEERLISTVREANRRIYELSRAEAERQGMGTTLTAAYLDETRLAVAHVGDSRAYLFRAGELKRLTQDHSLVAELVRRGKLTEEQAEEHPQRSIITRALGPEEDVEVDTWSIPLADGDVLLLCSDGLTSMIPESQITEILAAHSDLDAAAAALVAGANEAGGRDNITVILTRLEEIEGASGSEEAERSSAGSTMVLPRTERDKETVPSLPPLAPETEGGVRRAPRAATRAAPAAARHGRPPRLARPVAALVATVVVVGVIGAAGYLATRQLYFLGTDAQGIVTIYRGLPYQLPLGIDLYETYYVSGVPATLIPPARRPGLLGHSLRSQSDAQSLVRDLELGHISG